MSEYEHKISQRKKGKFAEKSSIKLATELAFAEMPTDDTLIKRLMGDLTKKTPRQRKIDQSIGKIAKKT